MTGRILMVDDEPDAKELFRQNFRREIRKGVYLFDFACSGAEALEFLDGGNAPEVILVLSDINMPGMTGIELLNEIKARWPDIPVFMITAYADRSTEALTREIGASAFLAKPVDFDLLRSQLAGMLGQGAP